MIWETNKLLYNDALAKVLDFLNMDMDDSYIV